MALRSQNPDLRYDSNRPRPRAFRYFVEDRFSRQDDWGHSILSGMEERSELPAFLRKKVVMFAEGTGQEKGESARYGLPEHLYIDRGDEGFHYPTLSAWIDASWSPPVTLDDESPRHREAAAVMDGLARGLLWKISDCTFIPGTEVTDLVEDYDDLRAVLRVVRAGWATAAPHGLYITDRGRDVASQLFVDR